MITYSAVTSHNSQQSKHVTQGTFQINEAIGDLKMATKFLQGVPPLLKVCTDLLTEYNNRNFARGPPTETFGVGGGGGSMVNGIGFPL